MLQLKQLRQERHLSQAGLALKLNLSQSTVSAYEVGDRTPDLETLVAIAQFFDVSLDYLAGLTERKRQMTQGDLTLEELAHLHAYRQLTNCQKMRVEAYMDGLRDRG